MILNNSSRGLLLENSKVLFIEYSIDERTFYSLPGGSIEIGESLQDCVIREFLEETGISIDVECLLLLNEFINPEPKFVAENWKNGIHQIESIFKVKRSKKQESLKSIQNYDFGMLGVKWLTKAELKDVIYYPEMPIEWFYSIGNISKEIYKIKKY